MPVLSRDQECHLHICRRLFVVNDLRWEIIVYFVDYENRNKSWNSDGQQNDDQQSDGQQSDGQQSDGQQSDGQQFH